MRRDPGIAAAGILGALEEFLKIARTANVPAEIYHLKVAGRANWHLADSVFARIERARAGGGGDHRGYVHL